MSVQRGRLSNLDLGSIPNNDVALNQPVHLSVLSATRRCAVSPWLCGRWTAGSRLEKELQPTGEALRPDSQSAKTRGNQTLNCAACHGSTSLRRAFAP